MLNGGVAHAMLVGRDLGHSFGTRDLFTAVDIRFDVGEALVVEGPSGSGKSTLLQILAGVLDPTSGHIVRQFRPEDVSWVLQTMPGLPARSVLDNAALYAAIDSVEPCVARRRAAEALASVALDEFGGQRVRTLSGGENQRLCVARAVACDRPVIFADEPTSQLDRRSAVNAMRLLVAEADRGRSVVIVTHDSDAIPARVRRLDLTKFAAR